MKIENKTEPLPAEGEAADADENKNVVTLSDGTVAKVRMPESLGG